MDPLMADVAIGGLLIMCWSVFFASHILVQKSFGPCLVPAFAMYRLCMVCLLVESINYLEPNHLVFGKFNHTRKLTSSSLQRFGDILRENPDAVLQFRSHSFHDPAVRRRFLIRLQDMGIAAHQLQPLPYAPSPAAAMSDYGRIHLHFDTFPVSGTTTTLDSWRWVFLYSRPLRRTTPAQYQRQFLSMPDSLIMFAPDSASLPMHARWLAERYRSVASRSELARHVRQSPICDEQKMPRMFVEQLQQMLRQVSNINSDRV